MDVVIDLYRKYFACFEMQEGCRGVQKAHYVGMPPLYFTILYIKKDRPNHEPLSEPVMWYNPMARLQMLSYTLSQQALIDSSQNISRVVSVKVVGLVVAVVVHRSCL